MIKLESKNDKNIQKELSTLKEQTEKQQKKIEKLQKYNTSVKQRQQYKEESRDGLFTNISNVIAVSGFWILMIVCIVIIVFA